VLQGVEQSSDEVLSGSGLSGAVSVDIIDSSELEDLLGDLGGNATGSSRGGHESDTGRSALSSDLGGDGMDSTNLGSPVTSSDGDDVALGVEEGSLDSDLNFLGALDADTDVSLSVSASDDSLESGSLSSLGLLLDGHDAHDLVGKLVLDVGDESVDDGGFLDGDGVGEDLLEALDLSGLDESSELGQGSPFVLVESSSATGSSSSSSSASSASSVSSSESSTSSVASSGGCCFGSGCCGLNFHFY